MNEPKPSYKSLEGQSVITVVGGCLFFLYSLVSGDAVSSDAVTIAREAVGVLPTETKEYIQGLQVPAFLVFLYKILAKFIDARTELKK